MESTSNRLHKEIDEAAEALTATAMFSSKRLAGFWEEARRFLDAGRYEDLKSLTADVRSTVAEKWRGLELSREGVRFYSRALAELESGEESLLRVFEVQTHGGTDCYFATASLCEALGLQKNVHSFDVPHGKPPETARANLEAELAFLEEDLVVYSREGLLASYRHQVLEQALEEYRVTGALGKLSLDALQEVLAELAEKESEIKALNNELRIAHEAIKRQRRSNRALVANQRSDWSRADLISLMDLPGIRKKNGDVANSRLADQMGVSDKTAKEWIQKLRLSDVAYPTKR